MRTVLVFDSGVGGLTVLRALRAALPGARMVYAADNAGFPYGSWDETALSAHVVHLVGALIAASAPDLVVIACNTASTLVLPPLRARFAVPFVGTVPAIKPAAERSHSGLISVLATEGTVKRDYTRGLIAQFAGGKAVTLVAASRLAHQAEAKLTGAAVDMDAIADDIAPAFVEVDGRRTDHVVLACTHFPLLLDELARAAPWPVAWLDPAPAIARRAAQVLAEQPETDRPAAPSRALFTDPAGVNARLAAVLAHEYGLGEVAAV